MSESNPFQQEWVSDAPPESQLQVDRVVHETTYLLAQTRPWVRCISVLGFLAAGAGIIFALLGSSRGGDAAELAILIAVYLLMFMIPSVLLWKYANRISDFLHGRTPGEFSAALVAQRSYWRYLGILAVIIIAIYGMVFLVAGLATIWTMR